MTKEYFLNTYLPQVWIHALDSIGLVLTGIAIALLVGSTVGILRSVFDKHQRTRRALATIIELPSFGPPLAWGPIGVLLFGVSWWSMVFIVFIGVVFPAQTIAYEAMQRIPKELKEATLALGIRVPSYRYYRKIAVPLAIPELMTGVRICIRMGWMTVVAAELFGQSGLGYLQQQHELNMQYDLVLLDLGIMCLIGLTMYWAVWCIEKKLLPSWKHEGRH